MSAPSIKPATRVSTTVLTYILNPSVNLGRFLTAIKAKFPKAVVTVRTDDKGYQNVSVTTTNAKQVTADTSPVTEGTNDAVDTDESIDDSIDDLF